MMAASLRCSRANELPLPRSKRLRDMVDNKDAGPAQKADAERRAQPTAPRDVLLDGHHGAEHEHPADAARADNEHQQHDRPATADAKHAVMDAQQEALPVRGSSTPVLVDEAEGRPALVEAIVLERAELKGASRSQNAGA